jgi:hypothetical protein
MTGITEDLGLAPLPGMMQAPLPSALPPLPLTLLPGLVAPPPIASFIPTIGASGPALALPQVCTASAAACDIPLGHAFRLSSRNLLLYILMIMGLPAFL